MRPSLSAVTPKETEAPEARPEAAWERTVSRDVMLGAHIGEYVVQKRIGSGGMGIVYEALQPLIHRRVAIKILKPQEGDADRTLLEEAQAVTSIRHRGIVDVFGFGTLPGIGQYMVMELLDGKPLDELLSVRGQLTAEETAELLEDILSPLQAAHDRGLIHRDLKPNNIFQVEDDGGRYVKILDFGLAKRKTTTGPTSKATKQGVAIGTPHYMSPEQAMARTVTPRSDLYSVGIIGYELITGRVPFDGQPVEVLVKQVNEAPAPPSAHTQVPESLERLILKLLAKDPNGRPASAAAVRAELRTIKKELASATTRIAATGAPLPAVSVAEERATVTARADHVTAAHSAPGRIPKWPFAVVAAVVTIAVAALLVAKSDTAADAGAQKNVTVSDTREAPNAALPVVADDATAKQRSAPTPDTAAGNTDALAENGTGAGNDDALSAKNGTVAANDDALGAQNGTVAGSNNDLAAKNGTLAGSIGVVAAKRDALDAQTAAVASDDTSGIKRENDEPVKPSAATVKTDTPPRRSSKAATKLQPQKTVAPSVTEPSFATIKIGAAAGLRSKVYVDGLPLCTTPCLNAKVRTGKRTLHLVAPNGVSTSFRVDVDASTTKLLYRWDAAKNAFVEQ